PATGPPWRNPVPARSISAPRWSPAGTSFAIAHFADEIDGDVHLAMREPQFFAHAVHMLGRLPHCLRITWPGEREDRRIQLGPEFRRIPADDFIRVHL